MLQMGPHEVRAEQDNLVPDLLAIILLIQPRMWLAFRGASARDQLFINTPSPSPRGCSQLGDHSVSQSGDHSGKSHKKYMGSHTNSYFS